MGRVFLVVMDAVGIGGAPDAERFFNGDVVQLRQRRYATYDYSRAEASLELFMKEVENG